MESFIRLDGVRKTYSMGQVETNVLDGMSFEIERGEFAVIVGPSGAGKTTVLNILGGMDTADDGTVVVDDTIVSELSRKQLTKYRRHDVGFVFQFYNLIQNLTIRENIELATDVCKNRLPAMEMLEHVGLAERYNSFPAQLSGGEQQRVSIARALAKSPKLLLCDEPTGALDYNTGKGVLSLLYNTCREREMTVILITHNQAITPMADKTIRIKSGVASSVVINLNPVPVERIEW